VDAEYGDAKGDGDAHDRVLGEHLDDARASPDPLGDTAGLLRRGAAEQDGELLAAEPADEIGLADLLTHLRGERPEHRVTGEVPVRVVDVLEVVDVGEQHRERLSAAPCPDDREVGLTLPRARVQHARLRIGTRLGLQLRVEQAALEQDHRRQRDREQQRAERAGDRDQDAYTGLGQVEQHPFAVPEHVDQPGVWIDEPRGHRHEAGVEHAEGDGAANRHTRLLRAHQPGVGPRVGQPDGGLALRGNRSDQPEQRGSARTRQTERGAAERPAVPRGPSHPQVDQQAEYGGRGEREQRWQQQRHRDPPRGQQVPRDPGRLPEPPGCLDADRAAAHQRGEQGQLTAGKRGPRRLPAGECQVAGEHAGHVADQRQRLVE